MRTPTTWTAIILLSALLAWFVVLVNLGGPMQYGVVVWFLGVCPGMAITRYLRLHEPLVEWTLAIALSFTIDVIVGTLSVMFGAWSSVGVFSIVLVFTVIAALLSELEILGGAWRLSAATPPTRAPQQPPTDRSKRIDRRASR
jgi:hypothetical protein